jgi:hypothetical protein
VRGDTSKDDKIINVIYIAGFVQHSAMVQRIKKKKEKTGCKEFLALLGIEL